MDGVDRKKDNWKMVEQFGRQQNNVGTAHSLINILQNFRLNGINLDHIFPYQVSLLYQPH